MEKIIDYLYSQGCKTECLQLFSVKYSPELNVLNVVFSSLQEYSQKECEKITKCVINFIENRCEVQVKLKKQTISADSCEMLIKRLLTNNAIYSTIFDLNNIKVKLSQNLSAQVSLNVDSSGFGEQEKEKFEKQCESILSPFGVNSIEFSYGQYCQNYEQILSTRRETFNEETAELPKTISVSFVKEYLGKMDSPSDTILPENVQSGKKNIFVAGEFLGLHEFTKKKEDSGKETKYYKFNLVSQESKIECVCFLKNGEDLKNLEENQKVVVLADSDEFRGAVSLRVRGLSLCKFDYPKRQVKTASKNYKIIKPEPFVAKEQISFLSQDEQIHSDYLLKNKFVVFDLETTGLNFNTCKIIEIGAAKIENGKITEVFSTFVNPQCHIPEEATRTNNITDDMVKDAPTFEQAFPDFYKFIEGATLVAHNINFDFPFISYYAKPLGYILNNPTQDTMLIAQKHLGQLKHFKLSTVCDFLGVSLVGAHRAVNDTVATAKVFIKLIEKYGI